LGASERLTEAELEKVADAWRPHRSAVALLAWHFYSNAPDI
jgi:DNA-3-methyladenine glycosylase II